MKVYIAGPVTGRADRNEPAFRHASERLRALGHGTVVPLDVVPEESGHEEAMRHCLLQMLACDAVALIPGWQSSAGARLERKVAKVCGMDCWELGRMGTAWEGGEL